jgi:hypothetical protein
MRPPKSTGRISQYSGLLALWLLSLAVVNLSLQVVENAAWLSMLSNQAFMRIKEERV